MPPECYKIRVQIAWKKKTNKTHQQAVKLVVGCLLLKVVRQAMVDLMVN